MAIWKTEFHVRNYDESNACFIVFLRIQLSIFSFFFKDFYCASCRSNSNQSISSLWSSGIQTRKKGIPLGYVKAILFQELDGILGSQIITPRRKETCDFTSMIVWSEAYNLVVSKPGFESRLSAFIRPFDSFVIHKQMTSLIITFLW